MKLAFVLLVRLDAVYPLVDCVGVLDVDNRRVVPAPNDVRASEERCWNGVGHRW